MARLLKFNGAQSLPGVGSPQVVADTAVGDALVGLGGQIGSSAKDIGGLFDDAQKAYRAPKEKREQNPKQSQRPVRSDLEARNRTSQQAIDDFEASRAVLRHVTTVKKNHAAALEKAGPGAIGLTENAKADWVAEQERLASTLPENVNTKFSYALSNKFEPFLNTVAAREYAENQNYFRRGYDEGSEQFVTQVREDPDSLEDVRVEGEKFVAIMPLPATEKAEKTRKLTEKLTETWVETRPLDEQISAIETELAWREAEGGPAGAGKGSSRPDGELSLAGQPGASAGELQIADRLKGLPELTLKRLHANAIKQKNAEAVAEAERIGSRIEETHGLFDPAEIEGNSLLNTYLKSNLIGRLRNANSELEKNIKAADWINSDGTVEEPTARSAELADRSFAFLANGDADRNVVAHGILRMKGVLPPAYVRDLQKGLQSQNAAALGTAYRNVETILSINPRVVEQSKETADLQDALARWTILTEKRGLSPEDAASELAKSNVPERQKRVMEEYTSEGVQTYLGQIEDEDLMNALRVQAH